MNDLCELTLLASGVWGYPHFLGALIGYQTIRITHGHFFLVTSTPESLSLLNVEHLEPCILIAP